MAVPVLFRLNQNNCNMKLSFFIAVFAVLALSFASCNDNKGVAQAAPLTVDSLMAEADALLGDTVTVEGLCSHLCKHGGRKAFLVGADSTVVLRCEATTAMGGAFGPDCIGDTLTVRGVVCENRIDEEAVAKMEAQYLAADSAARSHEACDTEKKAQGQANISTFEARMADYRAKIAERAASENKPYLSFYYLEALSYEK